MNTKLANLLGNLCRWRVFDDTGTITQYGVYQVCIRAIYRSEMRYRREYGYGYDYGNGKGIGGGMSE